MKSHSWALAIVLPEDVKRRAESLKLRSLKSNISGGSEEAREAGKDAGRAFELRRKVGSSTGSRTKLLTK